MLQALAACPQFIAWLQLHGGADKKSLIGSLLNTLEGMCLGFKSFSDCYKDGTSFRQLLTARIQRFVLIRIRPALFSVHSTLWAGSFRPTSTTPMNYCTYCSPLSKRRPFVRRKSVVCPMLSTACRCPVVIRCNSTRLQTVLAVATLQPQAFYPLVRLALCYRTFANPNTTKQRV